MSAHTPIQWCDSTANPVMGCDGCELWQNQRINTNARRSCYAGMLHERGGGRKPGHAVLFEEPMVFPGRMEKAARLSDLRGKSRADKPWLDGMPRGVFVSDMGDALSRGVPFDYIYEEIIKTVLSPQGARHVWLWLTKQPRRMLEFSRQFGGRRWPSNLWPGTSVTCMDSIERLKRIEYLCEIGDSTTTRFLSVEPQHGVIDLSGRLDGLSWVIQGGESEGQNTVPGTQLYTTLGARPFQLGWARSMRDTCADGGVAYFLKQLGRRPMDGAVRLKLRDRHGGDWREWPEDLRVRQVPSVR